MTNCQYGSGEVTAVADVLSSGMLGRAGALGVPNIVLVIQ